MRQEQQQGLEAQQRLQEVPSRNSELEEGNVRNAVALLQSAAKRVTSAAQRNVEQKVADFSPYRKIAQKAKRVSAGTGDWPNLPKEA